MLKDYEKIYPGFTERLLTRVEVQSSHRQEMEREVVSGNISNARLTAVLGTLTILSSMILAGFLALHGLSGIAIAIVLGEIVSITGVAFYRNYTKSEERIKKDVNKRLSKQKQIKPPKSDEEDSDKEEDVEEE